MFSYLLGKGEEGVWKGMTINWVTLYSVGLSPYEAG